jgi:poly-gamma-glutamate synthesis protein (capsule biosynthesis protein)
VVHGHSSHHPLGIEVVRDRPVLYGCGDFVNDYEGISGREEYRGDLSLMYLPRFDGASGRMTRLRLVPFRIERFRLHAASAAESEWLRARLDRESVPLGVRVVAAEGGLEARWS